MKTQSIENRVIPIDLAIEFRALDGTDRDFEVVISTDSVDRHGTIFVPGGMIAEHYNSRNNIVTIGHPPMNTTDLDLVVGTSSVRVEGNDKIIARVTLEAEGENPNADMVARKIKAGTLNMASIRARVLDYEWIEIKEESIPSFTRWELLDWGFVMHGSNPDASVRSMVDAITGDKPIKLDENLARAATLAKAKQKQRQRITLN